MSIGTGTQMAFGAEEMGWQQLEPPQGLNSDRWY